MIPAGPHKARVFAFPDRQKSELEAQDRSEILNRTLSAAYIVKKQYQSSFALSIVSTLLLITSLLRIIGSCWRIDETVCIRGSLFPITQMPIRLT